MPEPTTPPATPDYTTKTKAELVELLLARDVQLAEFVERRAQAERIERAREEELEQKRASRGPAKRLGQIDVYDTDEPEDVLERAKAVRAGKIPASVAKVFKSEARIRAPKGSKLAQRLGARDGAAVDVPLGTEIQRGEVPDTSIDAWSQAGAIVPIG